MSQPRDAYLQTQILTASPQRLRLMLIDGAIQQADLTAQLWQAESQEQALEALIRCRGILSELIAGIRPDASPLAQKVLGLYVFLYTALTEAQLSHDRLKLAHVRRVLQAERETWQQVCQQLANAPIDPARPMTEILAPAVASPAATLSLEA